MDGRKGFISAVGVWLVCVVSVVSAGDQPSLCLQYNIPENPSGAVCPVEGSTITADVVLGGSTTEICGAQFFLEFDTRALSIQSVTAGAELPDNPEGAIFSQILSSELDFAAGTVGYAVGGVIEGNCDGATTGPAIVARIEFFVRDNCASFGVCFRENRPPTLLAAPGGIKVIPTSCFGPCPVESTCAPPLRIIPKDPEVECADPCPCEMDTDCDDGLHCDGAETCVDLICQSGESPCSGNLLPFCNEENDACVECMTGSDGRDGIRCTYDQCIDGVVYNTDITDPPSPPAINAFDCTAALDPDGFCRSLGGEVCNPDGSCTCVEPPGLCLTTTREIDISTGFVPYNQFNIVTVDVELTATDTPVCAAQFFLRYAPFDFEFIDLTIGSDIPNNPGGAVFSTLLSFDVDDDAGTIDVAVGDDIFSQCQNATLGPGIIARLRFRAIGTCDSEGICFRTNNPRSLLGQPNGSKIIPSACFNADIDVEDSCTPPIFIEPRDPRIICVPTISRGGSIVLLVTLLAAVVVRFRSAMGIRRRSD